MVKSQETARDRLKKLQKAKKQLEIEPAAQTKKKTAQKKPPQVLTVKNLKDLATEDTLIRNFFTESLEDDNIYDLRDHFEQFSLQSNAYYTRKKLFEDILQKLPEELDIYQHFMTSYLEQKNENLSNFWELYQQKPAIKKAMAQYIEEQDEKARLKALNKDLFGDEEDEDTEIIEKLVKKPVKKGLQDEIARHKKVKRPIKMLDISPGGTMKEIPVPVKKELPDKYKYNKTEYLDSCLKTYLQAPWISAMVKNVYIKPIDSTDLTSYIAKEKPTKNINGETWFPVGKNFTKLVCGKNSQFRQQEGDIMKAYDGTKSIFLQIAFDTPDEFMIQNEKIFTDEKIYNQQKKKSQREKIVELGETKVSEKLIELSKKELSTQLHKIAPNIRDYGTLYDYDTEYIQEAIDTLAKEFPVVKNFLEALGNLIVYLQEPEAKIFKERIQENYYLPNMLVNLSPVEKFPEANMEVGLFELELSDENQNILNIKIVNFVKETLKYYYFVLNPGERRPTDAQPTYFKEIQTNSLKERCVNYIKVIDIPEYKVVYYEDVQNSKVYC
jgi:hypothetical protein